MDFFYKTLIDLNILNNDIDLLKSEFIGLKLDITLKDNFTDKKNVINSCRYTPYYEEYQYFIIYLCEANFSKLTFKKTNRYRNC